MVEKKSHAVMPVGNGFDTDRGREVGFAGAGSTHQNDVVGRGEELACMQLARQSFIDDALGEVEGAEMASYAN
jgi:hypothetical protein